MLAKLERSKERLNVTSVSLEFIISMWVYIGDSICCQIKHVVPLEAGADGLGGMSCAAG